MYLVEKEKEMKIISEAFSDTDVLSPKLAGLNVCILLRFKLKSKSHNKTATRKGGGGAVLL